MKHGWNTELAREFLFGAAIVFQSDLHQLNFRPRTPSNALPKLQAGYVAGEKKDAAFLNVRLAEFCQARADELTADAELPMAL
jgi:hypothetical protein